MIKSAKLRKPVKLELRKEAIRVLSISVLAQVPGGVTTSPSGEATALDSRCTRTD